MMRVGVFVIVLDEFGMVRRDEMNNKGEIYGLWITRYK